jgi:hypothetical protein
MPTEDGSIEGRPWGEDEEEDKAVEQTEVSSLDGFDPMVARPEDAMHAIPQMISSVFHICIGYLDRVAFFSYGDIIALP